MPAASWRRNAEGLWFAGGHNDKTFGMGYANIPKSKEGHTLADYERDFTLDRWLNDDVEKSKRLKPGETHTLNVTVATEN